MGWDSSISSLSRTTKIGHGATTGNTTLEQGRVLAIFSQYDMYYIHMSITGLIQSFGHSMEEKENSMPKPVLMHDMS